MNQPPTRAIRPSRQLLNRASRLLDRGISATLLLAAALNFYSGSPTLGLANLFLFILLNPPQSILKRFAPSTGDHPYSSTEQGHRRRYPNHKETTR